MGITVLLCLISIANAGFRCKLGGNVACTTSCVALGQTSGVCDQEDDCNCSEKSITLSSLERLLPSRCNLGPKFCKATCESLGRQGGTCEDGNTECVCSDQFKKKCCPKSIYLSPVHLMLEYIRTL